jgi:hypothetical protein
MTIRIPVSKATLTALRKGEKAIIEVPISEIEYVCAQSPRFKGMIISRKTKLAVVYQGF